MLKRAGILVGLLALAGCGGGTGPTPPPPPPLVVVSASGALAPGFDIQVNTVGIRKHLPVRGLIPSAQA